VKYEEITDRGLTITTKEGKKFTIEADTVVTALPMRPNTELLKAWEGAAPEVHAIGDCKDPQLVVDAIAAGSRIARAI
jgi:pyruvate/2-oxoglutarate dehydrogenase complex dihydrolipoamide dehydrogenase (E3) component